CQPVTVTAVVCSPENYHEYQNRGTDQKMMSMTDEK
ncbi:hypothetical protein AD46_4895, partial [Escherichia coli 6-175-07_S4_C3]